MLPGPSKLPEALRSLVAAQAFCWVAVAWRDSTRTSDKKQQRSGERRLHVMSTDGMMPMVVVSVFDAESKDGQC